MLVGGAWRGWIWQDWCLGGAFWVGWGPSWQGWRSSSCSGAWSYQRPAAWAAAEGSSPPLENSKGKRHRRFTIHSAYTLPPQRWAKCLSRAGDSFIYAKLTFSCSQPAPRLDYLMTQLITDPIQSCYNCTGESSLCYSHIVITNWTNIACIDSPLFCVWQG